MAADPDAFNAQLPFYRIKPLYLLVVAAFAKLTATVTEATVVVSVLSFCAFSLGLLWFAVRALGAVLGSVVGVLFALAPTTTNVAALSTPDALLMLLTGVAAVLFVRQRPLSAAWLLTLGVLVRTDLQVFNVCLAAAWLLLAQRQPRAGLVAGVLAGSILVAAAVDAWAGNYGYAVLYRHTFIGYSPHPASLQGLNIPAALFLRNIPVGVLGGLSNGGLWLVLALLGLCAVLFWRTGQPERMAAGRAQALACCALLAAVGASICVRFVLFPSGDLRLVAPVVGILAITLVTIAAYRPEGSLA